MLFAPTPANEYDRYLAAVGYEVLDTQPDAHFDELVQLASAICRTPIALVSFVGSDKQFFKARVGISACSTSRDVAFCAHTILQTDLMIVEDALLDERFADNPLVTGEPCIRFYAGMPVIDMQGMALGTVCVIDREPRQLSAEQRNALRILARQVLVHLELRQMMSMLRKTAAQPAVALAA